VAAFGESCHSSGHVLTARFDPGCVKTLRGITAPEILRLVVTLRAKKHKNSSAARHYDQISFRFRTAWTRLGHATRKMMQRSNLVAHSQNERCH